MTGRIGNQPATAHPLGRTLCRWLAAMSLAILVILPCPRTIRADTDQGPPPQAPPAQPDTGEPDEAPRRDFRMGTRDNMRMGRNKDGDLVMEVEPRPPKDQDASSPPIYVYPQVYPGYLGATQGQGATTGQGTTSGQMPVPARQAPPMVYSPNGPGQGPGGMIPAPPGPGRGGAGGMDMPRNPGQAMVPAQQPPAGQPGPSQTIEPPAGTEDQTTP